MVTTPTMEWRDAAGERRIGAKWIVKGVSIPTRFGGHAAYDVGCLSSSWRGARSEKIAPGLLVEGANAAAAMPATLLDARSSSVRFRLIAPARA